jgi:hypothetical protein
MRFKTKGVTDQESGVRTKPAVAALMLATGAFLIAAEIHSVQPDGLTVHEWGTFTSVAGEDGSAIDWDVLGGKDDLPGFVNVFGYRCFKWRLTGTVRMETPVMYFYSQREVTARVKVQFPHGVITEWYPKGDNAIYDSKSLRLSPSLNGIDTSLRNVMGAIGWSDIKVQPGSTADFPIEKSPSRYYAARGTDAVPIMAGGQHEKFLFYRGVGRFAVPLSARVSGDGKIAVENRGSDAVPSVMLFENRGGRLGYRNAGAVRRSVTLDAPSLDGSLSQLRYDLENALVAQGLFPKEAQAMVETWRDSWFEEGSRLIYVVPAAAVDAILPLQVEPAPSQTARVFVGRIELITPETKRAVREAIAKSDWSAVDRYGRFLDPILKRISSENPFMGKQIEQCRQRVQRSISAGACR